MIYYLICHFLSQLQRLVIRCWPNPRRYTLSVFSISLLLAKTVHIWSHLNSLSVAKLLLWGATFFAQDLLLICLVGGLVQPSHYKRWRILNLLGLALAVIFSVAMLNMAAANISFYFVTGAEIHWRQMFKFHHDAAGFKTLLYGLTGFLITAVGIAAIAWALASYIYDATSAVLSVLGWVFGRAWSNSMKTCCRGRRRNEEDPGWLVPETRIERDLLLPKEQSQTSTIENMDFTDTSSMESLTFDDELHPCSKSPTMLQRTLIMIATIFVTMTTAMRPSETALIYLSWTLPVSPFIGSARRPGDLDLTGMLGDDLYLGNRTALSTAPHWDFMPSDPLPGFEDWNRCNGNCTLNRHYSVKEDPLHVGNLDTPVFDTLSEVFGNKNVSIKHVVFIKLESTRSDVFPLRPGSAVLDTVNESYYGDIPPQIEERLANLSKTAEWLTGFPSKLSGHNEVKNQRGGIVASDAFTTGTYTLKSLPGSLCGITPLVTDFHREYKNHIYQPCLPHIFNLLNSLPNSTSEPTEDDFRTWPWKNLYMQSVTDTYDNQDLLTPKLGYSEWITKETLEDPAAKFFPPSEEPVCLYGYPDHEIREYIKDAIEDAETNHKRLFLTHLTGTTHEPWQLPEPWDYDTELVGRSSRGVYRKLKRYLNAVAYGDAWVANILSLLEETGIADSTLVVLAGDHGLSVTNGYVTPYDDPGVGAFRVPLVFSHPSIPPTHIDAPVSLTQVLPTVLDLLISSSSLAAPAAEAASSILALYEGQSLIRPQKPTNKEGRPGWQFTVMNTGGTWLSMRSTTTKYRLVVPLVPALEWRFSDLDSDPKEERAILKFDPKDFSRTVKSQYGDDAERWVGEAAHVARWWVKENWERWRFDPMEE